MAVTNYSFAYTPQSLAYLKLMPLKIRGQIVKRIQLLGSKPIPPGSKRLQGVMDGDSPVYRARQGNYRIIYSVRGTVIVILDIDHRKDVYR